MADQTHGAVDSLLGLLSSAIREEAQLLGGVQGDIQFIKDEMDSMNGFLLHLTKTKTEHNDQHRAWMKQVREIAYIAEDCIELYMRDLAPPDDGEGGLWASLCHRAQLLWTFPSRHRLATRLRELKVRVRDVGERRLRYGVTVPENSQLKSTEPAGQDDKDISEKRREFLRALQAIPGSFDEAFKKLVLADDPEAGLNKMIHSILEKVMPDLHISRMFLCALHANPNGTKQELESLQGKALEKYRSAAQVRKEVMIFCYSKLSTHYKSCLQYLTAFLEEKKIGRTSLVRRWVAEGLVAKGDKETVEEAGEACFNDLVFLGFIAPDETSDAGRVKICKKLDGEVRKFIVDMAKSENFVAGALPAHLNRQLEIRKIVNRQQEQQGQQTEPRRCWSIGDLCAGPRRGYASGGGTTAGRKDPMDDLVDLLKSLPEEYRLKVMDLGGCMGLKKYHLKSICKVISLRYLSLRKTNVIRLPRQINHLRQLETLDVRETGLRADSTRRILLPMLKYLLASRPDDRGDDDGGDTASPKVPLLSTVDGVEMPLYIGGMTMLEVLSHVSVPRGGAALRKVDHLKNLRKLGVVIYGDDQVTVQNLLRAIGRLGSLLSLSVWIKHKANLTDDDVGVNLQKSQDDRTLTPKEHHLERLDINGKIGAHGLPDWICDLKKLSKVTLLDTSLPGSSLQTLGKIQGLRFLWLRKNSFLDANLTCKNGEFQNLESLRVEDDKINQIVFQDGAAQKLEKISWSFTTIQGLSGVSCLHELKEIKLNAYGECRNVNYDQVINQLKQEVDKHPKRPHFDFEPSRRQPAQTVVAASAP